MGFWCWSSHFRTHPVVSCTRRDISNLSNTTESLCAIVKMFQYILRSQCPHLCVQHPFPECLLSLNGHLHIKNILINLVLLHKRMYAPNTSADKLSKLQTIWNGKKKLFFSPLWTREKQSFKMYLDLLAWACVDSLGDQAAIQAALTVNPQSWQWPPRKHAMPFRLVLLLGIHQSILVNTTQKERKGTFSSQCLPFFPSSASTWQRVSVEWMPAKNWRKAVS